MITRLIISCCHCVAVVRLTDSDLDTNDHAEADKYKSNCIQIANVRIAGISVRAYI